MKYATRIAVGLLSVLVLVGCGNEAIIPATGTVYGDLVYENGDAASDLLVHIEGTGLSARTDLSGRFVINGVLAVDYEGMGKYYVVRGEGEFDGTPMGFITTHFKVKGQQSYSIGVVTVKPTGSIRGRITLDATHDHSGVRVHLEGTSLETVTRADGTFLLDRVPEHEGYHMPCEKSGYVAMTVETMNQGGEEVPLTVVSAKQSWVTEMRMHRDR